MFPTEEFTTAFSTEKIQSPGPNAHPENLILAASVATNKFDSVCWNRHIFPNNEEIPYF